MIKKYTEQEYAQKAWEATAQKKTLYIYTHKEEVIIPEDEEDIPEEEVLEEEEVGEEGEPRIVIVEVAELVIADEGYYICYDRNYTDGTLNPNYEKEKEEKEKAKILKLSMTKLDLMTFLEQAGITYSQVKALLSANENAQKQWDLCERVYRFNPLLDSLGATMGITSKQLDDMFIAANTPRAEE